MGGHVKVTSGELTKTAQQIQTPRPAGPGPANPPDALAITTAAMAQLAASEAMMTMMLGAGDVEAQRLAQLLIAAANAYDQVDAERKAALDAPMNGNGSAPAVNPVTPDLTNVPAAPITRCLDYPPPGSWDVFTDWEIATETIYAGDTRASSVKYLRDQWKAYRQSLTDHAGHFTAPAEWEGEAAEACEIAMQNHSHWLQDMADNCRQLGRQAETLADAHDKLVADHPTLQDLQNFRNNVASFDPAEKLARWSWFQTRSEAALHAYAQHTNLERVSPQPPPSSGGVAPVQADDVAEFSPGTPLGGAPGAGGAPGGGGAPATPSMPSMPQMPATPDSAAAKTGGAPGGTPGGMPGGGTPGGAPGGGLPGGMPAAAKATPQLPTGPSLKPASRGGGSGGAGAGGGGGAPKMPLRPSVTGSAVEPSRAGGGAQGVEPEKAGPAGAMGGGMGGMPMGGHGAQQGKEKRRSPGLSPDEELYKEDRPWTEQVIGARRRKDTQNSTAPSEAT
ncbi:PPE domain-containing protein [Mycobacterium sp.]|uniref:PPE domain-containing protein n=1 Tax=Mycobacterium sp. TaxID=1785 RepID=UPI0031DE4E7A